MPEAESVKYQELINGLSSSNREEKILSIKAMSLLKAPEHADFLADLLSSPDEEIVEQVIIALGKIGNPGSVKYILEFILGDKGKLAELSFDVLSRFYIASAVDVVIKAAGSDQPVEIREKLIRLLLPYEEVRVAALMTEILGQTPDPRILTLAIGYFISFPSTEKHSALKVLSNSGQWEISLAANIALSRLKDEGAFTQIRRLVKSPNSEVRQIIVDSINKYPLIEDRKLYQSLFEDQKTSIRKKALKGLNMFGADERVKILKDWLNRESDNSLKISLLERAAKENSALFFDEFVGILSDAGSKNKNLAVDAISGMSERVVDRILIDFDRMALVVREQMVLVLGNIGGNKVLQTIKDCLKAKERWLKINSIEAAVALNNDELLPELVNLLSNKDTDPWVKATLVSALGRLKARDYSDLIAKQLEASDARVRANAIEALSLLEWESLNTEAMRLLKDRNDRVRVNAAIALWKCGNMEVFSELEKMSGDKSKWVRSSAVYALGKLNDREEGLPILLKMINDSEDVVYLNTMEALAESGDMRVMVPLLKEAGSKRIPLEVYDRILKKFSAKLTE
jgi:HEAT repeat protein